MKQKIIDIGKYFSIIVFLVFFIIGGVFGEISAEKIIYLILTELFVIMIPGMIVVAYLGYEWKSQISWISISYFTGYSLTIFVYIIFLFLDKQEYVWIYSIVALIVSIFYIIKRKILVKKINKVEVVGGFVLLLALIMAFLIFQLPNRSAEIVGYRDMVFDNTYWFKNCVAATKGYPLPELSVDGLDLFWHVFSNFEIAFLHFSTTIEIYDLCFTFSYIWQFFLLVGAIYTLFSEFLNNQFIVIAAMLLLLFTSGNEPGTAVYYLEHLYRCSLAFIEGYAASMYGLVAYFKMQHNMENRKRKLCWCLALFIITLGLKAPCGCILLVGIIGHMCLTIIEKIVGKTDKKEILNIIIEIILFLGTFFIIQKMFLVDSNALISDTSNHQLKINFFDSLLKTNWGNEIYVNLKSLGINKFVSYICALIFYHFVANTGVWSIVLICIVLVVIFKEWSVFRDKQVSTLLMMALSGIVVFQFISHPGFSQVYFLFTIYPYLLLGTCKICDTIIKKHGTKMSILFYAILVFAILNGMFYMFEKRNDIFVLNESDYISDESRKATHYFDVSKDEVVGLKWVKDNVEEDAVIATNKILLWETTGRTYVTSAYTEKQVYLEGYTGANLPSMDLAKYRLELLENYYMGDVEAEDRLVDEGVDYAVLFKNLDNYGEISSKKIYENEEFVVYKLE